MTLPSIAIRGTRVGGVFAIGSAVQFADALSGFGWSAAF